MEAILFPLCVLGGLGLFFGVGLGFADKVLAVKTDERIEAIKDILPGANCGGCGFAGCGAYAEAVVNEGAKTNACPVGGDSVAAGVASVMGQDAETIIRRAAYVKCAGYCDKSNSRYKYNGIYDCKAATMLAGGGSKECQYGCLGLSSCLFACKFDAIRIVNDIAVIDPDKCTACGACVDTCPKALIEFAKYSNGVKVMCNSIEKGKDVKDKCEVGCIGCKMCEKACKFDACHVDNNLAKIDYEKCTNCGDCVIKCPTKTIQFSLRRKG